MRNERPTYYQILRIPRQASLAEIKTAYRQLAKVYHPDATPGMDGSRFRQICEAYKTLSNPRQRQAYDREIAARENEAGALYSCYNLDPQVA